MKVLVIRFSSIGDIVLTSPVIRCLKNQIPDIEIHVLTKPRFKSIYEESPYISRVMTLDGHFPTMIRRLKVERYDFVADLHNNLRSWRVRLALRVRSKGFPKLNLRKYLLVRFKINLLPDIHIVDRYFKAVRPLGVINDGAGLDFFIAERDRMKITDLPESFRQGYYAFVIGGNHFTKILPAHQIVRVIERLDRPVVLLGGKEDMERGAAIQSMTGSNTWDSCGTFSLGQSAWLIEHALGVITNDTGLMHIAAALHKPIVSVWGNTVPEFGMYPYLLDKPERMAIIEIKGLSCRPCSKIGYPACPKGHFDCMERLSPNEIAAQLHKVVLGK